jgi:hypothetical protein
MTSPRGDVDPGILEVTWLVNITWDDMDTWDVPHVSKFWAFGVLKSQLERNTWHPLDWAMCPLPVFLYVATDHAVWRLVTPMGKYVTGCVGSKTPEGPNAEYKSTIDYIRHTSKDCRLQVKALWEKVQEESFETLEGRRSEAIHSSLICGRKPISRS